MRDASLVTFVLSTVLAGAALATPDHARQHKLVHLVKHDCGACHGMRLTGGLGPPLTASALEQRSVGTVQSAILDGRPGTPMPPWRGYLSPDEAGWLARELKLGTLLEASP